MKSEHSESRFALFLRHLGEALVFVLTSVNAVIDSMAAFARGRFATQPVERCDDAESPASPKS